MRVVVCVDDRLGMTFNRRRQSRDRVLCEDVVEDVRGSGGKLCISEYSRALFEEYDLPVLCGDGFVEAADAGDTCFIEKREHLPRVDRIGSFVIYRWNRHYPSDSVFDIDLVGEGFRLVESTVLVGYSHEKITKEIYVR